MIYETQIKCIPNYIMIPVGDNVQLDESKVYKVEIRERKCKRSLDANAYAWVLINQLAIKLKTTKEEVYRKAIKDTGEYNIVPIKDEKVDRFMHDWSVKGIGWLAEKLGESKHKGYINIMLYTGSSVYNTKEMTRLIDWLQEECRIQGIETKSDIEVKSLLEQWNETYTSI